MSVSKYESVVTVTPAPVEHVYRVLSHLSNLEKVRHLIPEDKVQELEIEDDAIRVKVDGLGQKITIRIIDRAENDFLKFGLDNMPLEMNFWIQMKPATNSGTKLRLTLHADIPMMFKMMLDKRIQEGINQAAQMLSQFPYSQWL